MFFNKAFLFACTTAAPLALTLCLIFNPVLAQQTADKYDALTLQTLVGTWQVTTVHIDRQSPRRRLYQYNDPALKGRLFFISDASITTNAPEHISCIDPRVTRATGVSGARLIKESVGGRVLPPHTPTPEDFGMPFASSMLLDVVTVHCDNGLWGGSLGPRGGIEGAWIIVVPDGLAMHWFDDTILLLSRVPKDAKPVASFTCEKAKTPVEKTICSSVALASFDRGVAEAFDYALDYFRGDTKAIRRLKAAQRAWLARRDRCGPDTACLEKSMQDHIEELLRHPERLVQ